LAHTSLDTIGAQQILTLRRRARYPMRKVALAQTKSTNYLKGLQGVDALADGASRLAGN